MSPAPDRLLAGRSYPLGATWDGLGVNFAVFSAHAEKIELCVFDPAGRREVARLALPECTDQVWHGYLPDARPGLMYGYRAHGPYDPRRGHRFNPHKLLLDPYARRIAGQVRWSDALFGYRVGSPRGDLSFDRRDSSAAMPRAVVTVDDAFNWGNDTRPDVPWAESVIYEMHVRGTTVRHPDIPAIERGTFGALADPRMIEHLHALGVTAVELLPIQAFLQDRFLVEKGLRNYWGYNTLCFFAPEPRYLTEGSFISLQVAVRRLHAAGIEVLLDVVYNHTCEGGESGPTLSLRGFDNASYYRLRPDDPRHLINDTGTGNSLNLTHPRVLQMVMDSLRYWATVCHVDGFRFDLGASLGREASGFDPGAGFFDALRQDPLLSRLKLISEPWDIGPGGYQLGNHPPGFGEWNDRFRDCVRRFWRGDEGQRQELAARLLGSGDVFEHHGRRPWASVNFVTAHDGFTLEDVVSYAQKHNEANGEEGRDGHNENYSANWGVEGPSEDPAIVETRDRIKRAMLATLLSSHGTPMLLAGDELGHTQNGNNNAYCQDNETTWIDWEAAQSPRNRPMNQFVSRLVALRRAHPSLRSDRYLHGRTELLPGLADVGWFDTGGEPVTAEEWNNPQGRALALRRACRLSKGGIDVTLVLMNAGGEEQTFVLPQPELAWRFALDAAVPGRIKEEPVTGPVAVMAHSVILLTAKAQA